MTSGQSTCVRCRVWALFVATPTNGYAFALQQNAHSFEKGEIVIDKQPTHRN
jgi:hypothetical protein